MRFLPSPSHNKLIGKALATSIAAASPLAATAATNPCGTMPSPADFGVTEYTYYPFGGDDLQTVNEKGYGYAVGKHIHGWFFLAGDTHGFSGTVTTASLGQTRTGSLLGYVLASYPTCFRYSIDPNYTDANVSGATFSVTLAAGQKPVDNNLILQESFTYQGNQGYALIELDNPEANDNDINVGVNGVGGFNDPATPVFNISGGKVYTGSNKPRTPAELSR